LEPHAGPSLSIPYVSSEKQKDGLQMVLLKPIQGRKGGWREVFKSFEILQYVHFDAVGQLSVFVAINNIFMKNARNNLT
jgi:hypothetical protein